MRACLVSAADIAPARRIRTPEDVYEAGRAACRQRGDRPTPAQCDRIAAILRPYMDACCTTDADAA
ncbi:hypothetical protein [Nonomuraea sp. NPDC023979]|uniref:hypothetical protein n=1 Tax=Nonomuraea sp. NPDC023979 TaxID=3154796 RepID=UPI0033F9F25A